MHFRSLLMKSCIIAFNSIIQLPFLWLSDIFLEASCADLERCLLQSHCGLLMHREVSESKSPAACQAGPVGCCCVSFSWGDSNKLTSHPGWGTHDRSQYDSITVPFGESVSSLAFLENMGEELLTEAKATHPCSHITEQSHPSIAAQMEYPVKEASTVYSSC